MIWVDNAIVGLLALYALAGLLRGVNQVVYALFIWVVGVLVACFFYQEFSVFLTKLASSPITRRALAFITLVLMTLMLGWLISLLSMDSSNTTVTFLSRLGGVVMGFAQGLLVVFALVLVAGMTPLPKEHWWQESKYLPPFQSFALLVREALPANLQKSLNYR